MEKKKNPEMKKKAMPWKPERPLPFESIRRMYKDPAFRKAIKALESLETTLKKESEKERARRKKQGMASSRVPQKVK